MKEKLKKIGGILIVLAIIGYLLLFYPAIISVNENNETECESILGLQVGC